MIDMDDPDHRKRRALVSKGFTPRQVADREARVRQISLELFSQRTRTHHTTDIG